MAHEPAYGGRRRHLQMLWTKLLSTSAFPQLDRWISEEFRHHKNFGSRDRRWYSDALFAGVRHGTLALFLDEQFQRASTWKIGAEELPPLVDAFCARYPDGASMLEGFRQAKGERLFDWILLRGGLMDGVAGLHEGPSVEVRNFFAKAATLFNGSKDLRVKAFGAGFPLHATRWLELRIDMSKWNENDSRLFLESLQTRPPLWLRPNRPETLSEVMTSLRNDGFSVEAEEGAIRAVGTTGLTATQAFRDGAVEIQDWASQHAGRFVQARPGQFVWDSCAGGGGKTLQIASMLANRGAVYASDIRAYKLNEVKIRARRAGFHNVRCLPWDGAALPDFEREIVKRGGFDWVLVDAPCSATGTWRRNPDAKFRLTPESVAELSTLQLQILRNCAAAVKPGGALVYATCSWIVAEDEEIVLRFLGEQSSFKLESMGILGNPQHDSDTLFAARLRREM